MNTFLNENSWFYYLHNIKILIAHMLVILYSVLITIYNLEDWPASGNYTKYW